MLLIALNLLAVVLGLGLSVLNLSLSHLSRSTLERRLERKGLIGAADWLYDDLHAAILATALLRTFARMAVYILTLATLVDLRDEARVTWWHLILAGVIAAAIIWITTIVIAQALSRYLGASIIARSLGLLRGITLALRPITSAGEVIDTLVRRLAGPRDLDEAEAELLESIEDTQRQGALDVVSAEILENVVEFTNTEVSQVMTPRPEIEGIEFTDDLARIRAFIDTAGHSRIPVYRGSLDNIVGILYLKDLIKYLGADASRFRLQPLLRTPIVVPETKPVRQLLTDFQHSEVHMAVVVDEFGATAGLVTIEDVLEQIVGDIRDEHEPEHQPDAEFRGIDEHHAEVDGRYRLHDLNAQMGLELPEEGDYDTVAGFVLAHLGHVPKTGERFDIKGVRFTALSATPTHVKRLAIEVLPRTAEVG
jgi:CBS domain containing-hemolysin-like protein